MPFRTPRTEDLSPEAARLKARPAPLWVPLIVIGGALLAAWAYAAWGG